MNISDFVIKKEISPALGTRWVVYLNGSRIGSAGSLRGAESVALLHIEQLSKNKQNKEK